jgi:hypothetical protein
VSREVVVGQASSGGTALASRRARREHASQDPLWDVWMLAAVVAGVLLTAGGFLNGGIVGALGGFALGVVLTSVGVLRNDGARARLVDHVQDRLARSRHRDLD